MTLVEDGAGLVFRYQDPQNYWSVVADQGVGTWTVNDPEQMRALAARGIDAICTDRPDLL